AGTISSGGHSLIGDPKFVDSTNDNYGLGQNSAAIDQGLDAGINIDIDGTFRPQGSQVDIGAYEGPGSKNESPGGEDETVAVYLPIILIE
ncbi:MAG: hypothetical protein GY869_21585, partial [Planctomycetes bacterium]|nr:hypothetical protein [Planctomycetota bacterium]